MDRVKVKELQRVVNDAVISYMRDNGISSIREINVEIQFCPEISSYIKVNGYEFIGKFYEEYCIENYDE